jgi:hypothetical protein
MLAGVNLRLDCVQSIGLKHAERTPLHVRESSYIVDSATQKQSAATIDNHCAIVITDSVRGTADVVVGKASSDSAK